MPPGVPQANYAGVPGAIAFGAAGGNLPGQFSPGALPASGSFVNPAAMRAAAQRTPFGPTVGPSPNPVGPPPANRAAALAAAISNAGQTQFGNAGPAIPGSLPQNLMGRTGANNFFDKFIQRGAGGNERFAAGANVNTTGDVGGSQLAGNQTLSSIAQNVDPNAQSQLAGNGTGAGGLLTPEMIDQLVADNPFLSREVLEQVLADNTEAGQQFVQQLLERRGQTEPVGIVQGFNDSATGATSKTAPNGAVPPEGIDYTAFVKWWGENGGTGADLPSVAEFNSGFFVNPVGAGSGSGGADGGAQDPLVPDVLNGLFDFNSPEAWRALGLPQVQAAFPGIPLSGRDFVGDRKDQSRQLAGPFSGGPMGLSGEEADLSAGEIRNIMMNEAGLQTARQQEAEQLARAQITQMLGSPAFGLSQDTATAARDRIQPGALDQLRGALQGDLDTSLAREENASLNRMRDLGLLGQGGASTSALGGLTNRLGGLRQQGQFDITRQMEDLTNQRIGQAGQTAGATAQITQALQMQPQLNLANMLQQERNPQVRGLTDFLQGIMNLQIGEALANRGPSTFESVAPLIQGGLTAAGSILGGPLGGMAAGAIGNSVLPSSAGTGPSPGTFFT